MVDDMDISSGYEDSEYEDDNDINSEYEDDIDDSNSEYENDIDSKNDDDIKYEDDDMNSDDDVFTQCKKYPNVFVYLTTFLNELYKCDKCPKTFKSQKCLTQHMRVHSIIRPFQCEKCPKAFKSKQEMEMHMSTHTDIKSFVCDKCPSAFRLKQQLTRHQITHLTETPFSCKECPMKFKTETYLQMHMMRHRGLLQVECELCKTMLSDKSRLNKHIKNVHSKKGEARRKNQEYKIIQLFESIPELHFDLKQNYQCYINFRCAVQKETYAFIDFMLQRDDTIFLIEVDEHQHSSYDVYQCKIDKNV